MNIYKQSQYVKYSQKLLPSTKVYEDFNERSVLVDVLSERPINVTEKDPGKSDYNENKEVRIDIQGSINILAKFRAYLRRLEILNKKIDNVEKTLSNISIEIINWGKTNVEKLLKVVKVERRGCKIEKIYVSEVERLQKLVASLRIYRL